MSHHTQAAPLQKYPACSSKKTQTMSCFARDISGHTSKPSGKFPDPTPSARMEMAHQVLQGYLGVTCHRVHSGEALAQGGQAESPAQI